MSLEDTLRAQGLLNEPPKGDDAPPPTPPKEKDTQEPPATPTPQVKEFNIKDHFPDYESIDQLKEVVAKFKEIDPKYTELHTKYTDIEAQFKSRDEELKALKSKNPYGDETMYKLSVVKAEKPAEFDKVMKLQYGNLDPMDIIKLNEVAENPSLKDLSPEDLDYYMKNSKGYKVNVSEDDDNYEKELKMLQIRVKTDAEKAKANILNVLNDIKVPDAPRSSEDIEKEQKERITKIAESWKPEFQKIITDLPATPYKLKGEAGTALFEYVPDEKDKEAVSKIFNEIIEKQGMKILSNGIEYSEKTAADIRQEIADQFYLRNQAKINEAFAKSIRAMSDEDFSNRYHNSSAKNKQKDVRGDVDNDPDSIQAYIKWKKNGGK